MQKWAMLLSLVASFVGSLFLWFSFQSSSIGFESATDSAGHEYLCFGDVGLLEGGGDLKPTVKMGGFPCPAATRRPLVAVLLEHPRLMPAGWGLLSLGFFLQLGITTRDIFNRSV